MERQVRLFKINQLVRKKKLQTSLLGKWEKLMDLNLMHYLVHWLSKLVEFLIAVDFNKGDVAYKDMI